MLGSLPKLYMEPTQRRTQGRCDFWSVENHRPREEEVKRLLKSKYPKPTWSIKFQAGWQDFCWVGREDGRFLGGGASFIFLPGMAKGPSINGATAQYFEWISPQLSHKKRLCASEFPTIGQVRSTSESGEHPTRSDHSCVTVWFHRKSHILYQNVYQPLRERFIIRTYQKACSIVSPLGCRLIDKAAMDPEVKLKFLLYIQTI